MDIPEPIGVVGAPHETLGELKAHFGATDLTGAMLILLTDTQGKRADARYAVMVHTPDLSVLTVDAFGPRFGADGEQALRDLAAWARAHGIENVKETVVNTYDFNRVVREPDEAEVRRLLAAANPSDLGIYLVRGG